MLRPKCPKIQCYTHASIAKGTVALSMIIENALRAGLFQDKRRGQSVT